MAFLSAISGAYKALRNKLKRDGVNIGGTAGFPRVEIHSVVEDAPLTKDDGLRSITCSIESISADKVADAVALTEGNLARIFAASGLTMSGWNVTGIVPGQTRLFSEQETLDSAMVIYRMITDVTIWIESSNN